MDAASDEPGDFRRQLARLGHALNRRLVPPVLEPGAMPWYSLFYAVFPLLPGVLPGFPKPDWALTFLALGTFLALYFGSYWVRGWRRTGVLLSMGALAV